MRRSIALVALLLGLSCATPAAAPRPGDVAIDSPTAPADLAFQQAAASLYQEFLDQIPTAVFGGSLPVALGLHQYDGRLPDDSPHGLQSRAAFLARARAQLEAFPAAQLSPPSRLDRDVFVVRLRGAWFDLQVRRSPWLSPPYYLGGLALLNYASRDYAPLEQRARAVLEICRGARGYLATARSNLEPKLARPLLGFAVQMISGQLAFAQNDVPRAFAGLTDAPLKADLTAGLAELATELGAFRDDLKARMAAGTDVFALGEADFLRMLEETEAVKIDLPSLEAAARKDLQRNQHALAEAAHAFSDKSLPEALAAANADRPAAAEVVGLARQQVTSVRAFLQQHAIVTIPSDEQAEVRESPAFMRGNFAAINQPGVFEPKPLPSFYFIAPPDPTWPEAEQRAYVPSAATLLFTTIHEVWPGHFLDRLHRVRLRSRITQSFGSYASNEGWAHYVEEMMWDEGIAGHDPRAHIAQLLQALMRDVRFLAAIGLHTHGMTVAEAHQLFVTEAYQDAATARQQSLRGTIDPMYLNYTLGKLMILKLRADWRAKVGRGFDLRAFHDQLLGYGDAPLPLIRRAMLGDDAGPPL